MSTEDFTLSAEVREIAGKGASRRLRRVSGRVPAIIYGDNKDPLNISVEHKELIKHLEHESFYSHIITLNIGSNSESVILKDLQRHPAKPLVVHADFQRVSKTKKININVPLHFINEDTCKGVKIGGGLISHAMTQIEVSCLASNLPEYIEVDVADLEIGQILHISDIKFPEGVESVSLSHGSDHDLPVVAVNKPKGAAEEEESSDEPEAE